MAVTVGFEPTVGLHPHNFSRVAPSAARTRHRGEDYPSREVRRRGRLALSSEEVLEQLRRFRGTHARYNLRLVQVPAIAHDIK